MTNHREADQIERVPYVQILILPTEIKWLVKYKDQDRVCSDRCSARRIAIQLAHESTKNGGPAQVVLRRRDGKMVPIWASGRDDPPAE
jgi:hypothetical protein